MDLLPFHRLTARPAWTAQAALPALAAMTLAALPATGLPAAAPIATQATPAPRLPASAQIDYDVAASTRGMALNVHAVLLWRHGRDRYELTLETKSPFLGSRAQASAGRVDAAGLQPERYTERARDERSTVLDAARGEVRFAGGEPPQPLRSGQQDRLSCVLQLGALVASDPGRYTAGAIVTLPTADLQSIEAWQFRVEGSETLNLPGGQVSALKFTRVVQRSSDKQLELWLAPSMDYLPARIRLTHPNGDFIDHRWRFVRAL